MQDFDNFRNASSILMLIDHIHNNRRLWETSWKYCLDGSATWADSSAVWRTGHLLLAGDNLNNAFNDIRKRFNRCIPERPVIAAEYTLMGLMAFDNCSYLLESTVEELSLLHKLGDNKAFYFIPYAHVESLKTTYK